MSAIRLRGFTLVEVLIALTIAGLVALTAHRLFAVAASGARGIEAHRRVLDREVNAHRWLTAAFLSLDVGQEGDGPFEGRRDRMTFTAWLPTVHGWLERQAVALGAEGSALVARAGGDAVVLRDSIAAVGFDYLLVPGADARWAGEWISPVSAPVAVRVRITRRRGLELVADTTLYLIKGRG